ncbi:MAG TPA: hypothetical protein P5511_00945 [Candidatus Goldiibacteriota bacterium]|mgnify:CR=1 FL=1|nr:hypothetical protein [Candidatus Goldiibacteriota bacterium]
MKEKTKLYIYAGVCTAAAFITMASGMREWVDIASQNIHKCLVDRNCLLYRGIIAFVLITLANRFIFAARMIDSKNPKSDKNSALLCYAGYVIMYMLYAVSVIAGMRNTFLKNAAEAMQMACLFDPDCLLPEFLSVIVLFFMSGYFIKLFIKLSKQDVPEKSEITQYKPAIQPKEIEEVKNDPVMTLLFRILAGLMGLLYVFMVFSELSSGVKVTAAAAVKFFLVAFIFVGIFGLFIALVITAFFTQKRMEQDYPELMEIMAGMNPMRKFEYKDELKELRSRTHKVMGYYNRTAARIGLALITMIVSLIIIFITFR